MKLWKTLKTKLNIERQGDRDPTQFSQDTAAAAAAPGTVNTGRYEVEFIKHR